MPPSYGTQAYWDERFTKENHFEWLLPPAALTAPIRDAIDRCAPAGGSPRILHIGCGSSDLSFHLRGLAGSAAQVVNVDYSEVAIRKCVEQERARRDERSEEDPEMVWKTADLLSPASVAALEEEPRSAGGGRDGAGPGFDVIVDKSTSDCIACADDVKVDLPYQFRAPPADPVPEGSKTTRSSSHAHPLHVITVNLAAMAKPATRWVCLSYSDDRFSFLGAGRNSRSSDPADRVDGNLVRNGFPDPRALWRVEQKREIVVEDEETPKGGNSGGEVRPYVHRPPTVHWLYTLIRTDQPL